MAGEGKALQDIRACLERVGREKNLFISIEDYSGNLLHFLDTLLSRSLSGYVRQTGASASANTNTYKSGFYNARNGSLKTTQLCFNLYLHFLQFVAT